jgi:hypothetical protein
MRRRAEARNTTHELMAFSGQKTLSEVERYAEAASKKRLADSDAATMAEVQAAARKLIKDQSGTGTDADRQLHKHGRPITQTGR